MNAKTLPFAAAAVPVRCAAFCALFLLAAFGARAQTELRSVAGIWENDSRIVQFTDTGSDGGTCRIVLKTYYGWFFDDTAALPWRVFSRADASGPGIELRYPGNRFYTVLPLFVDGDSLYLDFCMRGLNETDEAAVSSAGILGFWRPGGNIAELGAAPPRYADEVTGYYVTPSHIYRIRYWRTDAPFEPADTAVIRAGDDEYAVSRFVRIGDRTYTWTEGRSRLVRSASRLAYYIEGNSLIYDSRPAAPVPFYLSPSGNMLSFSQPYLTRSVAKDLDAYIAEHNSRRKPPRKPPL